MSWSTERAGAATLPRGGVPGGGRLQRAQLQAAAVRVDGDAPAREEAVTEDAIDRVTGMVDDDVGAANTVPLRPSNRA